MRLSRASCRFFSLLLALIVMAAVGPSAMADEIFPEWTVEIGQQLVAHGWENYAPTVDSSVVGYAVHVVELEQNLVEKFNFGFDLDTSQKGSGLWGLSGDDWELGFLLDTSYRFSPNLYHYLGDYNQVHTNESWLITIIGRPLTMNVSSTRLLASANQPKAEGFEIQILPKSVDWDRELIESEVTISYETLEGTVAHTHTTTWVAAISEWPIAVVSRQVDAGKNAEYQYFAVYLAGTLIPDELIPKDVPFISTGSVVGIQQFVEEVVEKRWAELGLDIGYTQGQWGWSVDGTLPIKEKHRVYGLFQNQPDLIYTVGVEGGLNNEFSFVAEVGNASDHGATLYLGLRDELYLAENLQAAAVVLPVQISLEGKKISVSLNWSAALTYILGECSVSYQVQNASKSVRHSLGVSLFPSKPLGARLSWSWDEHSGSRITAGVRVKF